jgi:hypothetical protein
VLVGFSLIFLLVIIIFKWLTARRLYKSFGVKGLMESCETERYTRVLSHPVVAPDTMSHGPSVRVFSERAIFSSLNHRFPSSGPRTTIIGGLLYLYWLRNKNGKYIYIYIYIYIGIPYQNLNVTTVTFIALISIICGILSVYVATYAAHAKKTYDLPQDGQQ